MKKYHMWTKEELKLLIALWDSTTLEELAEKLGCNASKVKNMANQLRKSGIPLQRKHVKGSLKTMIEELKKELGY